MSVVRVKAIPTGTDITEIDTDEILDLYDSVGWAAYTSDPAALTRAIANSTYVVEARTLHGALVGLARGMSDDTSIFYLQDILVRPEWQRRGVGRALVEDCLDRFSHVRQKVLLTDDLPAQHRFYEAMGYRDTRTDDVAPHTFVRIEGVGGSTAT
jgi:GNAT superfamily N-acetyltransferase